MIPLAVMEKIGTPRYTATYPVLLFLIYENLYHPGAIRVTNEALSKYGVGRHRKMEALAELKDLDLVEVTQSGKGSPVVKKLF
jgi:DNA-binding FadR family transcriptional regulator